ncbi:SPOR domain-containing protein [Novosphingobium sp. KCTC 2891]|uniref:SPOR domain-containing protein n=1 Tax=Novosphingobium sp. KCTC 2891 TaxID=2989730 RepID=UPI0022218C81|nr:SPOR domain-containing protein [Novosphingobium sp. KCTC 2891]MCW1383521.1 SPOR domain-containing protein [Novosphingobium sp. KCTC 2891]
MKSAASLVALSAALALAGCGGAAFSKTPLAPAADRLGPAGDYPVTIGDPFVVDGVTYTPSDSWNYDAVGYAVEVDGPGVGGGHRTLPYPGYVEVTALDSGKTILVRIDRRGPATGDALLELTPMARAQLGFAPGVRAAVRVRRVNPPEQERALLRTGQLAPARMDTPPGLLAALKRKLGIAPAPVAVLDGSPAGTARPALPGTRPAAISPRIVGKPVEKPVEKLGEKPGPSKPVVAAAPSSASASKATPPTPKAAAQPAARPVTHYVQVGAFSTRERAQTAARQVGGTVSEAGKFWRVRIAASGKADADAGLAKARRAGYADARVLTDR